MGIIIRSSLERQRAELEEFCSHTLQGSLHSKNLHEGEQNRRMQTVSTIIDDDDDDCNDQKMVCVTSGVSFLGLALVNCLLARAYSVRIIIHKEGDKEKVEEMWGSKDEIEVVVGNLNEVERLKEAFEGCHAVFHTSSFIDPAGLSGYSKSMAEIEVKASENVMEACASASSVKKCVLTSSLLACIWRDNFLTDLSPVINHHSWSHESLCVEKKLWCALGKVRAEKIAWKIAEKGGLKLSTICPGLITGPEFCHRNTTATIAYLKGANEMYADGLLASVDVVRLAEAHVCVFEAMNKLETSCGRYICFDHVIRKEDEVENLAKETGILASKILGNTSHHFTTHFELSKRKLSSIMSRTMQRCHNES